MKTMVSNMTRVCLGDVAHEVKQKAPAGQGLPTVGLEHLDPGEVELVRCDEGAETTFTKAFSKGQVLFGRRRAYLRKAAVAPFDGICSGDITVIAAKSGLSPRLLPFIIQNDALFEHAVTNSAGSLSPRVKWQSLSQFEFELPGSAKQEELADILWAAQETRSHYGQLLAACDDVVKSQFVEMFSDVGHTNPLEKLIIPNTRISYGIVQPGPGGTGDMGVLRPVDIVDGYLCLDEVKRIDEKIGYPYRRTELKGTEVLTVVRGATGQTVRSNASCIGMNVTRGIAVIRYDSRLIDPDYLVGYMNSDEGQHYIADHTKGATLQQINISDLKVMPIPVPSIRRQQQFAAFVTQVDKSKFKLGICGGML
ncbi:hypothetical protein [Parolsenella catena]|uniref:hypothetical protein n=1 Tax=Parolsenella catena TaxID=2003188 RepID=UPI003A911911